MPCLKYTKKQKQTQLTVKLYGMGKNGQMHVGTETCFLIPHYSAVFVDMLAVCKSHTRKLTVTCVFRRLSCCCKSYVTNAVNRWEMARDDRP